MAGDFLASYLPYLLRQADQTLSAPFYEALAEHGVQRSEWRVIAVLHERGSLSIRELTDVALSPQPTVTHAVSRLERRGLAERIAGTEDKRQRFVSLTPAGTGLAAELIRIATQLESDLLSEFSHGDLARLIASLGDLQQQLERRAAAPAEEPIDA